jgi:hypothetical protein
MHTPYAPYFDFLSKALFLLVIYYTFLFRTIRSGISPRGDDPKAWYDRAIRIVGSIMVLIVLTYGLILHWPRE